VPQQHPRCRCDTDEGRGEIQTCTQKKKHAEADDGTTVALAVVLSSGLLLCSSPWHPSSQARVIGLIFFSF